MKKLGFVLSILLLTLLAAALFSCQKSEPAVTQTGSTTTVEVTSTVVTTTAAADVFKVDLTEYTVVRYEKERMRLLLRWPISERW